MSDKAEIRTEVLVTVFLEDSANYLEALVTLYENDAATIEWRAEHGWTKKDLVDARGGMQAVSLELWRALQAISGKHTLDDNVIMPFILPWG